MMRSRFRFSALTPLKPYFNTAQFSTFPLEMSSIFLIILKCRTKLQSGFQENVVQEDNLIFERQTFHACVLYKN